MLFALVVLGLAVEGPFDYTVPADLSKKIKVGARVWINFRNQRMLGYVVKLAKKSKIKHLKPILELLDHTPLLDKNALLLAKQVSEYYCCSWGEAIEAVLPGALRKGRKVAGLIPNGDCPEIDSPWIGNKKAELPSATLIHDLDGQDRWGIYLEQIKKTLNSKKSVIIILPDISAVLNAREIIKTKIDAPVGILYRKEPNELEEWLRIKSIGTIVVVGTRSSVFAPVKKLGLVIIDEEHDSVYKQEQTPHYNAREVAFMRSRIEKARLILGSTAPSLEYLNLAKKNNLRYTFIPRGRDFPEIKTIDVKFERRGAKKKNIILSKYLEDSIASNLDSGGKTLLFLNRRGFATYAFCHNCGMALECPRCNINLAFHFEDSVLNCRYCNFKMQAPKICPNCSSGYIKFAGAGIERIESELSRIFAQAKIKRIDFRGNLNLKDADIFVATSTIIKEVNCNFDLVGILGIDNSLNRIDFRSAEKTFALLLGLLRLSRKKIIIQTSLPKHNCLQALLTKNIDIFYEKELSQRRELRFPPFRHLIFVKLRGKREERVREASFNLFKELNRVNKSRDIKIISLNPGQPSKLRDNFYWQLLVSADSAKRATKFLKINLKNFPHSGIIVTVDVDPV